MTPLVMLGQPKWTEFVNPFIGTGGHGHTFPGATRPFGMVQLSPDTRLEGWDGCSGYHYDDQRIYGFSHTHLSGTGVADYADILVKPMSRPPSFERENYASSFSHADETAKPGYYSVFLKDDQIKAELTTTTRVGMHRYTYPENSAKHLILDLTHRDEVLEATLEVTGPNQVKGMRRSSSWAKDQTLYFVMEFDHPISYWSIQTGKQELDRHKEKVQDKHIKARFEFGSTTSPLLVKVGLSWVDHNGALANMAAECPHWDFDLVKDEASAVWNEHLSAIEVESNNAEKITNFYTALYHCMIHPNVASDVDGRYRGMDQAIHRAKGYTHYTVFSLWDTYRALHPLLTIIDKPRVQDFIQTMLSMYRESGRLPVWELAANETNCMIGYHAVSVIFDAYQKNIRDWDSDFALEAMVATANADVFGITPYRKKGYLEIEDESESVSKTLEYAYNDWCISEMARMKRKEAIHETFQKRSIGYRNLFDHKTQFIRPRANGGWLEPFDPREVTNHYTEANGWQYTFYVPHDLTYIIEGMGGMAGFEKKLDAFFESPSMITGRAQSDITGLIGQYAQGNEPSHHAAYLYAFCQNPGKTQKWVEAIRELYKPTPDGLPGNEDCGQMSAWYVFSALGFYPVTPGNNQYIFGLPLFDRMRVRVAENEYFDIEADRRKTKGAYIDEVYINNEKWFGAFIPHHFINGKVNLDFRTAHQPGENFGKYGPAMPKSEVEDPDFVEVPAIVGPAAPFRNNATIEIIPARPGHRLLYSTEGKTPDQVYNGPFTIKATARINAVAIDSIGQSSPVSSGIFYEVPNDWQIDVITDVHPQYPGGGPEALIDGVYGDKDWRKGRWHGYQGDDLELVIDLGKRKTIKSLGMSVLQDTRAWIVLPQDIVFSVSRDGKTYKEALRIKNQQPVQTEDAFTKIFKGKSKVKKGRYVKIKARNFGVLPEWHPGAGGKSYIFTDEVIIE